MDPISYRILFVACCFSLFFQPSYAEIQLAPPQLENAQYYFGKIDEKTNANMCVIQQYNKEKKEVFFSVWNGYPFDISVVFHPILENMASNSEFPLTLIFPPNSTTQVFAD